ncbi:MAG: hypothetical protein ACPGJF_19340 [Sinimarinibacterium flocculans]|uniref:hypothetical protein n=1 Tax=Sinimarinibacterium flocculans TaxID=985250 RepID=UPI003C3FA1D7
MSIDQLSFREFQSRYEAAFPDSDPPAGQWERYGLYAALLGIVIASVAGIAAINTTLGQVVVLTGFSVEIVGVIVYVAAGFVRIKRSIQLDDRSSAQNLDRDYLGYEQIVSWLRRFPRDALESRLVFTSNRTDSWQRGTSLVMGGVEKLGILPVIVALYLQFKDTSRIWPPDITTVGGVFALLIIGIYVIGMWALTRRLQVTRFERLLKVALDPTFKVADHDSTAHADRQGCESC